MDISQVFTYQDCIDHLVQYQGSAPDDAMLGRMRTAVQMAYQEVCWSTDWQYFHKPLRLQLSAFYETGTIAYTASTRVLALSGGTWPTWAASGRVLIDNIAYQVASRTDGTNLVLDSVFCPQANISSGTSYRIYRSVYILPTDFRKVFEFTGEDTWTSCFTTPTEWLKRERYTQDTGTPWLWTIMQTTDQYGYGRYGLFVQGYPDTDETFDCIYVRAPRDIKYSGYETAARAGTVSCSASTAVTGSSTTFSSDMIGSVIRFTSGTDYPKGIHSTNPYVEQHVISVVGSTTGLTLDTAATNSYSGKKYVITDPIDLPPSCRTALLRCCEKNLDSVIPSLERLKRSQPASDWAIREARERESLTAFRAIDSWGSHSHWRDGITGPDLT